MNQATFLLATLALIGTAFAGCSDAPPSGEFSSDRRSVDVMGNVELEFQEKVRPIEGQDQLCPPFSDPPAQVQCVEPHTRVSGHFSALPDPSNDGYTAYWTSSAGEEMMIAALSENATAGMWDLPMTEFDEDHSDDFDTVELRMGDILVATSSNNEGPNAFEANGDLLTMSVSGAWESNELTVTVSGAASNVTYTGWLVTVDVDTGEATHAESFPISGDGEYVYEATMDIDDFSEFHVHVAGSKFNVAIADI